MAIPLPNLDDRSYADLVAELRALIPRHAPGWTDHNASDPGIMLVELFAWRAEALIYRTNRVPDTSRMRLLQLLGAEFSPARPGVVDLWVRAESLTEERVIPRHLALSATAADGTRLGFITRKDLLLSPEAPGGTLSLYQVERVRDEALGVGDGTPFQSFALGLDWPVPKIDDGIPHDLVVRVAGTGWKRVPDLLDSGPEDAHYCFEPFSGRVRFGNGTTGAVPPAGAEIRADYFRTRGPGGHLPAGTSFQLLEDPGVSFGAPLVSTAAVALGAPPTDLDGARDQALALLQWRFRAISSEDFETLVLEHFPVARVVCVPDQDLTGRADDPTGHLSLVLVPYSADPRPQPSDELMAGVLTLLDERRLITSKVHVLGPVYRSIRLDAEVVAARGAAAEALEGLLLDALAGFFDPLKGGEDGKGWPFGRDVYASEVYQLLEAVEGVDHVERLSLGFLEEAAWQPAAAGRVPIAPHELVHLDAGQSTVDVIGTGI